MENTLTNVLAVYNATFGKSDDVRTFIKTHLPLICSKPQKHENGGFVFYAHHPKDTRPIVLTQARRLVKHFIQERKISGYSVVTAKLSKAPVIVSAKIELRCPVCLTQHVDEDEWVTKLHKTHLCERCAFEWQPFPFYTVGVKPWL